MRHRGLTALVLCLAMVLPGCRKKEPAPAGAPTTTGPGPAAGAAARAGDSQLVEDKALVDGRLLAVSHSKWDLGQTADLFDADPATFARTAGANPAVVEIGFPEPRPLSGVWLKMGGADFRVSATVKTRGEPAPKTYIRDFTDSGFDPELELDFGGDPVPAESLRIEVLDLRGGDGHIHIRTLRLR